MRKSISVLVVCVLLCAAVALASEKWVGTLTSATLSDGGAAPSVNNTTTATTFTLPNTGMGAKYSVQCDAAAVVRMGSGSSTAVGIYTDAGTTSGVLLASGMLFDILLDGTTDTIAMSSVSGTADCSVFVVNP